LVRISTDPESRIDEARQTLLLVDALEGFHVRRVELDGLKVLLDAGVGDGLRQDDMALVDCGLVSTGAVL